MQRIIGIDPGSLRTGYGIIEADSAGRLRHIAHGCINLSGQAFLQRIAVIHQSLQQVLRDFSPQSAAVEQVFLARNADSALKLGQARGAALVALLEHNLPVSEYTALQIKKATVGAGHADKTQVEHMVRRLLGVHEAIQADAADALACAICHAHSAGTQLFWQTREVVGR
ncbi:crossover junction endodeoxyribonuclease RuvC [Acidithiobacillus sp. AMEEHan]|uniref:crossover junction endodeoxyribonuclease RuvC n=1 Tax=Acidithiobacillus sp. AMEEHan TaxID=2994951 RepID=UPI0027E3DFEF|nr:crossover junction endodeoxyribonuclease RuvC [Acidithiobacillus sp. AMEEHan]